jgi:hypothetical protein
MPEFPPDCNPPPTTAGGLNVSAEPSEREIFAPCAPPASESPAVEERPRESGFEKSFREFGFDYNPTAPIPETGAVPSVAPDADMAMTRAGETPVGSQGTPRPAPPKPRATAFQIYHWIKQSIQAQTYLPEDLADLVAIWAISTWFQGVLPVLPCLAISGPPDGATRLLSILRDFCLAPVLLAEFRRGDLKNAELEQPNVVDFGAEPR